MHKGPARLRISASTVALTTALGLVGGTIPASVVVAAQPSEGAVPDAPETAAAEAPAAAPAKARPSSDGSTRAAILPLVIEGDPMPDADRTQLAGRLVEGLERGDFDVVVPDDVVAASASAASCRSASCYTSIASAVGATHVVVAVINVEDRDYQVDVTLVDGKDGSQVASGEDSCQICGVAEVGDLIDTAAATLRTKLDNLAQGPATLVVSSNPEGASVSIDGELKGTTPFNAPVLAGKHVVSISLEGYITVEREVTFVEGIEDRQTFTLDKVPSRLPARPWGWVSLGAGIGGLGAAVFFTAIANQPFRLGGACEGTGDDGMPNQDADGNCRKLWNTEPHVLGTAIAGAALTTLGIAILLNSPGKKGKKVKVEKSEGAETARVPLRKRLRWGVGAGSVSVEGRF